MTAPRDDSLRAETKCPPAGATAEGRGIAVGANAGTVYPSGAGLGKPDNPAGPVDALAHSPRARARADSGPESALGRLDRGQGRATGFHALDGRKWAYRGKRGQVLAMLVDAPGGITQWDTLPWHTRLGGTIHAMRADGLSISTEVEGQYRHARYRLHTPGRLVERAGDGKAGRR